jgi:hypothetical protein
MNTPVKSVWRESAEKMIALHGVDEARARCIKYRDMNSSSTPSYSFHNAILKQIEQIARELRL